MQYNVSNLFGNAVEKSCEMIKYVPMSPCESRHGASRCGVLRNLPPAEINALLVYLTCIAKSFNYTN